MGYQNNQFPVFLTLKTDGSLQAEVRKFEDFIGSSMNRVAGSVNRAGDATAGAFNFAGSKRDLESLGSVVDNVVRKLSQARADPLGIGRATAGAKNSPYLAGLTEQITAENKLNDQRMRNIAEVLAAEDSLDAQRRASVQERIVGIQRQFDIEMNAIRERRDAQMAAFAEVQAEGDRILALDRQRAEQQRKLVTGREYIQAPQFDPTSANAAAVAARSHAIALDQVARAAENVSLQSGKATATDVAFANQMRASATAADVEAARLEELAATQNRVAVSAGKLNTANLELGSSQRNSRFATLQASQQFQDFFIQLQSGQNPMVAFSQQASQLAFVMSSAGGETGKFAKFISGGWGTAIFGGIAVLSLFTSKLFDNEKATKKNQEAKELHKKTLEQLVEAINAENEALGKNLNSSRDSELAALASANAKRLEAERRLENAKATLAEVKALQEISRVRASRGGSQEQVTAFETEAFADSKRIAELEARIDTLQKAVATANVARARATVPLVRRGINEALDPRAKITGDYEKKLSDAQKVFDEQIAKGVDLNVAQDKLATVTLEAAKARDAANKALDEKTKADREEANEAKKAAAEAAKRATYTRFLSPVDGAVSSGFGPRKPPKPGASSFHPAIDFDVPVGTPVKAPAVGTVTAVGFDPGLGKFVIIDHGAGTTTRYGHLSSIDVSKGTRLAAGEEFAKSGNTGLSTGPHLDFQVKTGGKAVDPRIGRFKTDEYATAATASAASEAAADAAERALEKANRAAERLAQIGANAADKVAGITAQFDKQPRLIDAAAKATDELNETIAKLSKEKPEGFEQLIADAEKAKGVVQEGLLRPLQQMVEESAKNAEIDALVLAGKEDQADVLREIYRLEEQMGPLKDKQRLAVEQTVAAERLRAKALAEQERNINRAVQSAENLQAAVTGVIKDPFKGDSWKEGLSSIFDDFKTKWAESISTGLLGNLGADFESALRAKSDPLGQAGAELTSSALELHKSAVALSQAAGNMQSQGGPTAGQVSTTPSAYLPAASGAAAIGGAIAPIARMIGGPVGSILDTFGNLSSTFGKQSNTQNQILTVNTDVADLAQRQLELQKRSALLADPVQYYNMLGSTVGKNVDKALGSGQLFEKIGGKLGDALQGAAIGQMGGQLAGMLGIKKISNTGSMLGGAAGMMIGGPLGALIGGALGGILGGLFKKTKKGSATIGGDQFGNLDVVDTDGNSGKRKRASTQAADSAIDALQQLADQLGVLLDPSKGAVSIGIRGDNYRVDTMGQGKTKKSSTVKNFGEDYQAAIEFAIQDLIEDGVLEGIRQGTKKLLTETRDLGRGIAKALKFEGVFTRLKEIENPLGAAIDQLDKEFQELRRIFAEAGASAEEYSQLEKLYAYERAEAVKNAAKEATSTLKALLDDLTHQGDYGLSLRTRRDNAMAAFAPFQQSIGQGQAIDDEAFAEAARSLLDIERQIYGSTSQYFDTLNLITQLTRQAISNTGQPVSIPGITPALVTQNPAVPPPTTSPLAGVSQQAPGGALTMAQQIANQQYTMAQIIVNGIREQTVALQTLLSLQNLILAVQTGTSNAASVIAARGNIDQPYGQLSSQFGQLITLTGQVASNTAQLGSSSGPTGMFDTPWWMAPGAGSAYSGTAPAGTRTAGPANTDSPYANIEPATRLTSSVSRF